MAQLGGTAHHCRNALPLLYLRYTRGASSPDLERCEMIKKLRLLGLILILALVLSNCAAEQQTARRPNILLIVADDMGYSDLGPFGGEIATPTLDQLANEGLRLSNFHVLPSCSPTRSVLLSGTDNHVAGMGTMGEMLTPEIQGQPGYEGYLNFQIAALPEVMREAGYHTYMVGKWHLGDSEETLPSSRGFEETFILAPGGGSHWSDQRPLSPLQPMVYRRNGRLVEELPDDFYSTKDYTDHVLEWMRADSGDDQPFFAYLSYTAPHDPLHAPREYIDKYQGRYDGGWDVLREGRLQALKERGIVPDDARPYPRLPSVNAWDDLALHEQQEAARDMEVYAAMVDYLDEQIKRVFDYLKDAREYENTLILFLSDNGANGHPATAYPGQTDEYLNSFDNSLENRGLRNSFIEPGPGWAQASMSPSRMFKAFTAEGGIRAPLIVKLPGAMANAGVIKHSFVHVRDIMPTILAVADIAPPREVSGRPVVPMHGGSLLDFLEGSVETPYAGASQVGYELFGMKAFFDGDWKILWMPPPFGPGDWQLYNLKDDPAEMVDLSDQDPSRRAEMIVQWEQYRDDTGVLDFAIDLSGSH